MNEEQYEKSIARPTFVPERCPQTLTDREIKEEREFSRGVWEAYKRARDAAATNYNNLHDLVHPIPDAPPKSAPVSAWAIHAVNRVLGMSALDKSVADEIIREVRARTVK